MTDTPRPQSAPSTTELKQKILFTLPILVIYRIGAHITAPGVNVVALTDFIRNSAAAGCFGLYDALGGGLSRATVFALGIMPYISACIIFQIAGGGRPVHREDAEGRGGQEEDHAVDALPHRGSRDRPRRTASRCSPSRFPARCRTRASRPGSSWW